MSDLEKYCLYMSFFNHFKTSMKLFMGLTFNQRGLFSQIDCQTWTFLALF